MAPIEILSFDIEISDDFTLEEGQDLDEHAPFHTSVAATVIEGGEERLWFSKGEDGQPSLYASPKKMHELLEYLEEKQAEGIRVCAWNGLSFDLKWIGWLAGDLPLAARIAMKSYDPMFQFFKVAGFPVGLGVAAKGLKVTQEKLMDGADAPKEWRDGNYDRVKAYVLGDCTITNKVVRAIMKQKVVRWTSKRGRNSARPIRRLKTVEEVLREPMADQGWMDTPLLEGKFCDWALNVLGRKTLAHPRTFSTMPPSPDAQDIGASTLGPGQLIIEGKEYNCAVDLATDGADKTLVYRGTIHKDLTCTFTNEGAIEDLIRELKPDITAEEMKETDRLVLNGNQFELRREVEIDQDDLLF